MNYLFNENSHVFVIAESGSNWKCGSYDDDLKRARELIKIAANAGADAIKFQTFRPETTYVQNAGLSDYLAKSSIYKDVSEIFEKFSMPYEMIPELSKYCKDKNIMFMSTPFSVTDAREIDPFVEIHKVASFEINHVRLLEFLAKTQKPIIISTGASTYTEIDFAVNLLKQNGNTKIALLQCTSKYPAPISSLNLTVLPKLQERYHFPVGLSDHSMDPIIGPLMAVGLGAKIIEKHFTLDKKLPGPDHAFALNPDELRLTIESIRKAELAKGTGKKEILQEEEELGRFATRSIQAIKNILKGDILQEDVNFAILRPGKRSKGLPPRFFLKINGKKATKNIAMGEGITEYE